MTSPSSRGSSSRSRNDPGVSNDPRPSTSSGGFDAHIWTSLNQIFEKLGGIEEKLGNSINEQTKLRESVEKHDKIIVRVGFSIAGAIAIMTAIWFLYENFLKDHIAIK